MKFQNKLRKAISQNNSLLCVGLDPDPGKVKDLFKFNQRIIDQTADLVCAYKPNSAFYSAVGTSGIEDLKETIDYIHKQYPQIPVILDAKRGDVGHASEMYAQEVFDYFGADAATVNPYLGEDGLEAFFKRSDKGIIVLCKTSNPSADDFQNLKADGEPFYLKITRKTIVWNKKYKNILMVIGATYPKELGKIRKLTADMTFLIPGVAAQGGDLQATLKNGLINPPSSSSSSRGSKRGLIISASRSIIYDQNPRLAAQKLKDEINKYR